MEPMEYGDDYDDFAAMGLDIPHPYVDEDRTRLDDVLGDAKRLIDDIESMKAADRRGGAGGSGGDELPAGMGVRAGGGAEESAPCCRTTGPCAWDRVCEVHLKDWEKASGGEKYCDWLRRNGHTVPAWMQGAKPGQRGSNASHAAAGVFFAPEKRPDALLDVAVSERAEYWDGGAADVEPEPLAFPMMDDDDDEFAYPPPASATQTRETNGGAEDEPHGGPETPSLGAVVDERRNDGDGAPSVAVGEAEFAELAEDAYGGGDGRAGRGTLGASASSDSDANGPDEDADVNYKLFAMGFCDSGDGGSWMGADADSSDEPPGGNRIRVGLRDSPSLGSKIAAAFALGIAGQLAGPYSAHAAPSKAAAAATATAHKPSPNLFQLPEGARKSLDDFVINRAKDVRGVMNAIDDNVNDPWDIEDVWLIIAWHFAIAKGRRKVYDYLKERDPENTVEWERSFWNWLGGPMKVIGGLWIGMYLWDNGCRVGELLEMSPFLPTTIMEQFDRGMYTLAGGIIATMATDNYLPEILTDRLGIKDSSTKLVLTRLAVVTGALCTAISSALVFGLPPKSLLGFGGIGGLTFGLAAKDLVSNFIGGSMLAIMRPFSPGEKIYLMAVGGRFRGTNEPSVGGYLVKEIGWYQTTLIPKDTRPTTVPNGFFLGANVINISRQTARIIVANIRVRLDDAPMIPKMTEEITQYLADHPSIINPPQRPIRVHCRDIKDDHLAIRVETHCSVVKKDPFLQVQQELLLGMFDICKKNSTGPAWTVLNTVGEDNRPWLPEGKSAR